MKNFNILAMNVEWSIPEHLHSEVMCAYWLMLKDLENIARRTKDVSDRKMVEAYARLWNNMTGETYSPVWEE